MDKPFDVAVIGAGPAGAATALALCRLHSGHIILLEADHFDRPRIGESIPPDIRMPLGELGLWESFLTQGHDPCYGSCSSWGDDKLGFNDYLFNPNGHGWHLDRRRFDPWLAQAAGKAGAELCLNTGVKTIKALPGGGFRIGTASGKTGMQNIKARFIVDATGRRARVACQLGATRLIHDRLSFLYGFFPAGSATDATSLTTLEAVPDGWWYAARLPDRRLVAAVAADPALVAQAGRARPAGIRQRFTAWHTQFLATRHIHTMIPTGLLPEGPLIACDALSSRLDTAAGDGWLAVGDAASSFDPLSAQGIYKALQDGLDAARAINGWLGGDTGTSDAYATAIRARFDHYRGQRDLFYNLEQRWWDMPFWVGRRGRTTLQPG